MAKARIGTIKRNTTETQIALRLNVDGTGKYTVSTGIRFFDHMLELFTRHGGFDLTLKCTGDLDVDQHHTVEDVGIALECLPVALADDEYVQWYANEVRAGRERMEQALTALGVSFWPSHANFILMKIGSKHRELVEAMRRHGVLLRDRSADPGCEGNVRITIGIAEHVTRGIAALTASLQEINWKAE